MDIVEKMKNWDTWDALLKDLEPYLLEVAKRMKSYDQLIIQDFYIMELIIIPKMHVEYSKAIGGYSELEKAHVKAYCDVVADIMKLHRNSDKLDDVLEAIPQLLDREKEGIRRDWKKQPAIRRGRKKQHANKTKGDENFMEDSEMEEYLKAKCAKLGDIKAEIHKVITQKGDICEYSNFVYRLKTRLSMLRVIREASSDLHDKYKKLVQIMKTEDNSCSASSEDNICESKEPEQE